MLTEGKQDGNINFVADGATKNIEKDVKKNRKKLLTKNTAHDNISELRQATTTKRTLTNKQ